MTSNKLVAVLVAASVCAATAAWARWQRVLPQTTPDRITIPSVRSTAASVTDSALAVAESFTVTNDPFRLSNTTPSVRFDPATEGQAISAAPQLRPTFVLKAIVGGPPWQAVIDGIPGQPTGTVARNGSKFDRVTVRSVTRDSVILQGADTSWVLSFRGRS